VRGAALKEIARAFIYTIKGEIAMPLATVEYIIIGIILLIVVSSIVVAVDSLRRKLS
jgi:hypothetical protein